MQIEQQFMELPVSDRDDVVLVSHQKSSRNIKPNLFFVAGTQEALATLLRDISPAAVCSVRERNPRAGSRQQFGFFQTHSNTVITKKGMDAMNATVIAIATGVLLATAGFAGDLNVAGNLNVTGNISAATITVTGGTVDLTEPVIDFAQPASFYRYTLTNNTTWTFTNHVAGRVVRVRLLQDATGGWSNTWPADVLWPGGARPTAATLENHFDLYRFVDDGTNWLGAAEGLGYSLPCVTNCSYGLQFTRDVNYAACPYSAALYPQGDWTLEGWFIWPTLDDDAHEGVAGNQSGTSSGFSFVLHEAGPYILVNHGGWYDIVWSSQPVGGDSTWHHFAAVKSSGTLELFIDGVSQGTTSCTNMAMASNPFYIGRRADSGNGFNGTVDSVRLSSVARYSSSFTPEACLETDAQTIALWRFDEGTGTTVVDASGNGHDVTLAGSPLPNWVAGLSCGGSMMLMGGGASAQSLNLLTTTLSMTNLFNSTLSDTNTFTVTPTLQLSPSAE